MFHQRIFIPLLHLAGLKFVARTGFESGWRQSRNSAISGSVPFSADLFHSQGSYSMDLTKTLEMLLLLLCTWWNSCGLSAANRFSTSPEEYLISKCVWAQFTRKCSWTGYVGNSDLWRHFFLTGIGRSWDPCHGWILCFATCKRPFGRFVLDNKKLTRKHNIRRCQLGAYLYLSLLTKATIMVEKWK